MQAIIYHKKKSVKGFSIQKVEDPRPSDQEVLVKIDSVSLNAGDYRLIQLGMIPKSKIFGAAISGRIVSIGKDVRRLKVGDEVVGDLSNCGFSGLAEYVAAPENILALKPSQVSFETAAAIPLGAVTALQALKNIGKIKEGDKVLISGAGGGVGTFAVQLAKQYKAHVTATCSEKNLKLVKSLGADVVLDYTKTDFSAQGEIYDVIIVINGKNPISKYKKTLVKGGQCVIVGGPIPQILSVALFGALISIGHKRITTFVAKPDVKDLDTLLEWVEKGKINPIIDKVYPFEETGRGMEYLLTGHVSGKIIIKVSSDEIGVRV